MDVVLSRDAAKQFDRIPKIQRDKIVRKLKIIQGNPQIGKYLVGELSGIYSVRAWPYRLLYRIVKDQNQINVVRIAHRKDVYR